MGKRLLLGPLMIALLIVGLALDQAVDLLPLPAVLQDGTRATFPPGTIMLPLLAAICVLAARELSRLLESANIEGSKRMLTFAALVGVLVSCLVPELVRATTAIAIAGTAGALVLAVAMGFYSRHRTVEGVVAATGGVLLAFVYLGLMAGFLMAIRREHHVWVLAWILLSIKACDIGAYFTGKAIGKHKLIPWLSPGKTWEGLAGGLALSMIVGVVGAEVVCNMVRLTAPPWYWSAALGLVLGFTGQVGDLLESILKRDARRKDSGGSIPGFGGVLDVLDSVLLAAPLAFWWLRAAQSQGFFTPVGV